MKKCVIVFIFVLGFIFINGNYIKSAVIDQLDEQLDEINNQIKQNKIKVSQYEKEATDSMNEINKAESEISTKYQELDQLQKKVDDTNKKVAELENSLQNASQTYDSAQGMYVTRLKIIYEKGLPSLLDILFESKGLSDFFSKVNVLNSLLDYDRKLVNNMQSQKEYVSYVKKDIETQKLQLETLKYDKEKTTKALEGSINAKQAKVEQLNQSKEKTLVATKILLEQQKEAQAKLDEEIRKASLIGGIFGGGFKWPVSSTNITAGFGSYVINGIRRAHYGVDVGISVGTPVYAAARGEISTVFNKISDPYGPSNSALKWSFKADNGGGFGNYIMIAHGSGYVTVYGHLSRVIVSSGKVEQGDLIGYSGSTGYSTGAHLHFEIRRNTVAVNPSEFFSFLR